MKAKNKIITSILLASGTAASTSLINHYVQVKAISRNLLEQPKTQEYKWRLGNISYTKVGAGNPLLLIHDLDSISSGCEWEELIPVLKDHYTVYVIDLLGCGRSEKPNLTYTNFLYVQLLNDFITSEIGHRTNVIATGAAASLAIMACCYNENLFEKMLFINPESFSSSSQIPGKTAKAYKKILDLPIIGALLYHIAVSKKEIEETFRNDYFYDIYNIKPFYLDKYYEAAHYGKTPKAIYSSARCHYTKCKISHALQKINHSIYILCGSKTADADTIIEEYVSCNPSVEASKIANAKHLPQLEMPNEVSSIVKMFFD